ncbi:hypothetical protein GIB67_038800 [Kingdonia uniflora]|uniref:Uncharacterized protein n=1 Tax=Kingdonia uniflora TaxID=39325 RepID=A0A7J7LMH3_9MAGN|nr:hypothetical protein GIB67_036541 [Kingdonia uniflora]KAF6148445.1 hypothetical protein GIB67_038800 [Kingdonia uniflora]
MATLARLSKQALKSTTTLTQSLLLHHQQRCLSTTTAPSPTTTTTTPSITDRVKWDYRGQRRIIPLGQWLPKIAVDAYVAPNVVLAGQVVVSDGSSVWSGSVLRGDLNKITIGFSSNVQERCVIHAAWQSPTGSLSSNSRVVLLGIENMKFSVVGPDHNLEYGRYVTALKVSNDSFIPRRAETATEELHIFAMTIVISTSKDKFIETMEIMYSSRVLSSKSIFPVAVLFLSSVICTGDKSIGITSDLFGVSPSYWIALTFLQLNGTNGFGPIQGNGHGTAWNLGLPAETSIDRYVTIGAYSLLRSCTIEPECIIGQHSILMEGSLVETHAILEAGSVVPPGRRIPTGELWAGNPAKFVRTLTHEETLEIPKLAVAINDLSRSHFSEFLPYSTVYLEVEKLKTSFGIPI